MSPRVRRLLVAALVVAAALWLGSRGDDRVAPADDLGNAMGVAVATLVAHPTARSSVATRQAQTYDVSVDRQKAAQAAGTYDLSDLPGTLSEPVSAARIGKNPRQDKMLRGAESLTEVTRLTPGSTLAIYGRPESRWANAYWRRAGNAASMTELLSYARQLIGMRPDGQLVVCLCGHAGQGPCIPLWAPRDDVSLAVQPNDLVLRFADVVPAD